MLPDLSFMFSWIILSPNICPVFFLQTTAVSSGNFLRARYSTAMAVSSDFDPVCVGKKSLRVAPGLEQSLNVGGDVIDGVLYSPL